MDMYICIYVNVYTYIHIYLQIYIYIYTYVYMYTKQEAELHFKDEQTVQVTIVALTLFQHVLSDLAIIIYI